MGFVKYRTGVFRSFQPVHQDQSIHQAGRDRPMGLFAQDGDVLFACRPGHDTLGPRHQTDHPASCCQIGTQKWYSKTEACDGRCRLRRPEAYHLIPDCPLRHAAKLRAIIEIAQVQHIKVHCSQALSSRWLSIIPADWAKTMALELMTIPCLSDNYAYLVHDNASGQTAVVDVPEAAPILAALQLRQWALSDIWITHHHGDHIDGVADLKAATGAMIVGNARDAQRLPPLDLALHDGLTFTIGAHVVQVIDVPGHTIGHIAYHIPSVDLAFTGDSLMSGGCGRMFEGNAPDYWASLSRLAALSPETLICSGHEYTTSNLRFAQSLEPELPALKLRVARVMARRGEGLPTVPVPLSEELATNPFLRAGRPEMKTALGTPLATDIEVFANLRARKDRF